MTWARRNGVRRSTRTQRNFLFALFVSAQTYWLSDGFTLQPHSSFWVPLRERSTRNPATAPVTAVSGGGKSNVGRRWMTYSDDGDGDDDTTEPLLFDDFEFEVGGASDNTSKQSSINGNGNGGVQSPVLQERLNQLVVAEQALETKISENWKSGHWSVRGCSLDPGDEGFEGSKVQISALLGAWNEEHEDVILVGRTDGSLCWLRLGTSEYMATFTNQLVAKETSDTIISVSEELKRQEGSSMMMPRTPGSFDEESLMAAASDATDSKFELLAQLQASSCAIVDLAVVNSKHMFVLGASQSGLDAVRQFEIREDGPVTLDGTPLSQPDDPQFTSSAVVAIKAVRDEALMTVTQSGQVSLWRPDGQASSSFLASVSISIESDDSILSCDVDEDYAYFGSARGLVWIYSIDKILHASDNDEIEGEGEGEGEGALLKSFLAFASEDGISSICGGGEGTMGGNGRPETTSLLTGCTSGQIKQWELIPRGKDALEYWPKMASQKLPGKVHILDGPRYANTVDHDLGAILALRTVQKGVVLSASKTQLTIWNTETGEPYSDMQGLDFFCGAQASCLVLSEHLLVTNGMEQYLCVHDFSIDDLDPEDMILPMGEE